MVEVGWKARSEASAEAVAPRNASGDGSKFEEARGQELLRRAQNFPSFSSSSLRLAETCLLSDPAFSSSWCLRWGQMLKSAVLHNFRKCSARIGNGLPGRRARGKTGLACGERHGSHGVAQRPSTTGRPGNFLSCGLLGLSGLPPTNLSILSPVLRSRSKSRLPMPKSGMGARSRHRAMQ